MSAAEFEGLWGIEELSEFLSIPVHTIRGWRTKKYGPPARKVGKHLRYDPAKVRAWFEDLDQDNAA
jgi:DNA-binding transcriptional MerR regulator